MPFVLCCLAGGAEARTALAVRSNSGDRIIAHGRNTKGCETMRRVCVNALRCFQQTAAITVEKQLEVKLEHFNLEITVDSKQMNYVCYADPLLTLCSNESLLM